MIETYLRLFQEILLCGLGNWRELAEFDLLTKQEIQLMIPELCEAIKAMMKQIPGLTTEVRRLQAVAPAVAA